jgi:hypothetical protein
VTKKQTESSTMQHIRIRNNRHNNGARGNNGARAGRIPVQLPL